MKKEKIHGENYKYKISPTKVLDCLRKVGLEIYFKKNTFQFCEEDSKRSKEIGTQSHLLFGMDILGKEMSIETVYKEEITNVIGGYEKFKRENPQYQFTESEVTIDCDEYKYSMTTDAIGKENEDNILGDWKTGHPNAKGELVIYPNYVAQVSMYLIGVELHRNCELKRSIIVLFDKTSVDYIMRIVEREEVLEVFENICKPALKIYAYQHRKKGRKK